MLLKSAWIEMQVAFQMSWCMPFTLHALLLQARHLLACSNDAAWQNPAEGWVLCTLPSLYGDKSQALSACRGGSA